MYQASKHSDFEMETLLALSKIKHGGVKSKNLTKGMVMWRGVKNNQSKKNAQMFDYIAI